MAHDVGARRVTLPAISTGIYRFPLAAAAEIAVSEAATWLDRRESPLDITFVLFSQTTYDAFSVALSRINRPAAS